MQSEGIMKLFKPLLAGRVDSLTDLRYPVLMSQKLDGVRATVQGGQLLSRTLKPIPNRFVQAAFAGLPDGYDGELIAGDPTAPDAYRRTVSIVMSDDKPIGDVKFHLFDQYGVQPFHIRIKAVQYAIEHLSATPLAYVEHVEIANAEDLQHALEFMVANGAEGVMTRNPQGRYKEGRSTAKEQILIKHKMFEDADAVVVGTYELLQNNNPAMTNALGRTERSTAKGGKVGKDTLGGFNLRDCVSGVEFSCGTGLDDDTRAELWAVRDTLVGKVVTYKYFPTGSDTRPRFPVFMRFREDAA